MPCWHNFSYTCLVWIFHEYDLFQVIETDATCILYILSVHIFCSNFILYDCTWFIAMFASPCLRHFVSHMPLSTLHETLRKQKPVWNLKLLWKVIPFTLQFHCGQLWDLKPLSKIVPFRAHLHETQSELKPAWNLKPFWKVVQFTWQFSCGNFPNHSKILLYMRKC